MNGLESMLIICFSVIIGSIVSHSALWYRIGKIETKLDKINGVK